MDPSASFATARNCPRCGAEMIAALEDAVDEEKRQGHQAVRVHCPSGCWNVRSALPQGVQGYRATVDSILDRLDATPREMMADGEIREVSMTADPDAG